MLKVDSHQHFWIYDPVKDAWITEEMSVIKKDFLPDEISRELNTHQISGCVAVQADQSEKETEFLIGLAQNHSFIKGVVGWVDLTADNVEERLAYYRSIKQVKGFRYILQAEPVEFMLDKNFLRSIGLLQQYGFTYDILVNPQQLSFANHLVAKFPDQPFVIDHLAKPYIKSKGIDGWREDISKMAAFPNVYCKVSGLVTEADWHNWSTGDFVPYMDVVFNAFGSNRVMYGSDWPVCNLAGGYAGVLNVVNNYVDKLSLNEQEMFWAKNVMEFYGIDV
jgi:L-fuconolactonase